MANLNVLMERNVNKRHVAISPAADRDTRHWINVGIIGRYFLYSQQNAIAQKRKLYDALKALIRAVKPLPGFPLIPLFGHVLYRQRFKRKPCNCDPIYNHHNN